MRLDLDSDQEFFRETTARFLDELAPPAELRRLRDDPTGFDRRLLAPGRRAGLDVAARERGRTAAARSAATASSTSALVAHEFGRHAAPGPLLPTNVVAAALSDVRAAVTPLVERSARRHVDRDVVLAEPAPNDGLGRRRLEIRVDGGDVVLNGVKRPVESAAEAAATCW